MVANFSNSPVPHNVFMPNYALDGKMQRDVDDLLRDLPSQPPSVVTEAELEGLPETVQRYFRAAGIIGQPRTRFMRARFQGQFRRSPQEKWMPMVSEQYNRVDQPARFWYVMMNFMPLIRFYVCDSYRQGEGNMFAKLTRWFKMFDERSPELTQGELLTLLNDMLFYPSAFLSDYIRWEALDDRSARVSMTTPNLTVSAVIDFNERYDVVNFHADRYALSYKRYQPWSTPLTGHQEINGVRIPTGGAAVWQGDDGPFDYVRMSLVNLQTNVFSRYP